MRVLTLYGRPGCHLCDEARAAVAPLVAAAGDVDVIEVDIESDDELLREYLERIPVLELDGRVIGELVPDPGLLSAALLHTSAR